MSEEIAKGGGKKSHSPTSSMDQWIKKMGNIRSYIIARKLQKRKFHSSFNITLKWWYICPSVCLILLHFTHPHDNTYKHMQGKLCASAGKPHSALCLKMYVTHDGLRADALCLSADYDCWPRPDRPISDISFIARRGLVTLSVRLCASLHVHQFRFPNLSLLMSPHSSSLLSPSFSSQGVPYMAVLLNITVSLCFVCAWKTCPSGDDLPRLRCGT